LLDYALGDLHSVNILTLNQELTVINDLANGRVKNTNAKKKELEKDINDEVLKLDKRLQELERRTNRILYDLSQN
jgi:Mg2+ and Co2+ transporter CorA